MFNKKLIKPFLITLLILLLVLLMQDVGVKSICGTTLTKEQINYELQHIVPQAEKLQKLDYKTTLAVRVFIVSNAEGETAISDEQAHDAIQNLNNDFSPIRLGFEICNITYLNSKQLYNYSIADESLLDKYLQPNVINLFFVKEITLSEPGNTCGYTYYPVHEKDFIILKGECCIHNSTLSHEMGHFFGLYHTHEKSFGQELADESNCYKAGDLLCDTPADPGSNRNFIDENCNWIGKIYDSKKMLYNPDLQNYMSYGRNECRKKFTKDQYNKMAGMYCRFKTHIQQLDVKFKMSDSLVFPNEAVTLSATGGSSYHWSTGDSTRSIVVNPISDTVISLQLTRPGNCSITRLFPIRVIPDSYLSGPNEVCEGEIVEVHVNSSKKGATYQLRENGNKVGNVIEGNGGTITLKSKPLYKNTQFSVIACNSFQECDFILSDKHYVRVASIPNNIGLVSTIKNSLNSDSSSYLIIKNSNKHCYYNILIGDETIGSKLKGNGKTLYFKIPTTKESIIISLEISTSCKKKRFEKVFFINPEKEFTEDTFKDSLNKL